MGTNWKQKGKELFEKGKQLNATGQKYKEEYDKYKELYELGKNLLDEDTRTATLYKEGLKYMLKKAGAALGSDLTKHPYFVINQPAMEALWEALTASKTIENAQAIIKKAEKDLGTLETRAATYTSDYDQSRSQLRSSIGAILGKGAGIVQSWHQYVRDLNRDRFAGTSKAEAEEEVRNSIEWAGSLLVEVRPLVSQAVQGGAEALKAYAALSASGAQIILADKTYQEKINKLKGSGGVISSTFGKLEEKRRYEEQVFDVLGGNQNAADPMQSRVERVLDDATSTARAWESFVNECLSENLLRIGMGGGYLLPWEITLPVR
jgi:hypothetical protein